MALTNATIWLGSEDTIVPQVLDSAGRPFGFLRVGTLNVHFSGPDLREQLVQVGRLIDALDTLRNLMREALVAAAEPATVEAEAVPA